MLISENKLDVGIVVIGRNEGSRLICCLESVALTNLPIVYVDSRSTDNSVKEAESNNVEVVLLDSNQPLSAARARNAGFERLVKLYSSIEYIHFIDADCELDPGWLKVALLEFERQENVAVVCGRLREKYRNSSFYMILCDIDWYRTPGVVNSCGGIATYRRSIFELNKGFNANLIAGEEPELCLRIREKGYDILCVDAEMGTHDSAMVHFSQWWTRCVKVGFGYMNGLDWGGWSKQYRSALFWALILPIFILIMLSFTKGFSLLGIVLYPAQVYRIFKKIKGDNLSQKDRLIYSFFCILSKFPESQGILTYFVSKIFNQKKIIQYK